MDGDRERRIREFIRRADRRLPLFPVRRRDAALTQPGRTTNSDRRRSALVSLRSVNRQPGTGEGGDYFGNHT